MSFPYLKVVSQKITEKQPITYFVVESGCTALSLGLRSLMSLLELLFVIVASLGVLVAALTKTKSVSVAATAPHPATKVSQTSTASLSTTERAGSLLLLVVATLVSSSLSSIASSIRVSTGYPSLELIVLSLISHPLMNTTPASAPRKAASSLLAFIPAYIY